MDVKQILEKWLKDNGYGGLYSEGCGCKIGELVLCDNDCSECEPGFVITKKDIICNGCEWEEQCEKMRGFWCIRSVGPVK